MTAPVHARPATAADAAAIADIYNEGIRGRTATFETRERTPDDVLPWIADAARHPVLVAEREGAVVGWVAASAYRPRACYEGVAEFSVYVRASAHGRGSAIGCWPRSFPRSRLRGRGRCCRASSPRTAPRSRSAPGTASARWAPTGGMPASTAPGATW